MKLKITFYATMLTIAGALNIYYYWNYIWTAWAKYYIRDQDVVISLTTTPYRIEKIEATMHSLSRQNIPIRQIYINIPYVFKRDNSTYKIPDWLDVYPNTTILRTEDYGPATKLLGTLKHGDLKPNTIVIVVDDDNIYSSNMALRLAVRAKQYPNQAVGICGADLELVDGHPTVIKIKKDKKNADILEGFAGAAYRKQFFDDSVFEVSSIPTSCYNSDDVYLSFHLAKNNILRQTVTNRFTSVFNGYVKQEQYGFGNDALYRIDSKNQDDRYFSCVAYLNAKYPTVTFNYHNTNGVTTDPTQQS